MAQGFWCTTSSGCLPGGPKSSTPLQEPARLPEGNKWGNCRGSCTASRRASLAPSRAPTSAKPLPASCQGSCLSAVWSSWHEIRLRLPWCQQPAYVSASGLASDDQGWDTTACVLSQLALHFTGSIAGIKAVSAADNATLPHALKTLTWGWMTSGNKRFS